jgi:D-alanine-D-alanine ligase
MQPKKNIAILAGGFSQESHISEKSGKTILKHINRNLYNPTLVHITEVGWMAEVDGEVYPIDRNDFSFYQAPHKISFDGVFMMVHGTPGENGLLQGYFDLLGIPYSTGGVLNTSVTFNKGLTTTLLRARGFNTANSILLRSTDHYSATRVLREIGLPCFVKPNEGGSSFGIAKVKKEDELHRAIDRALEVDEEVIIESFLDGAEISCGVIPWQGLITPLPLTEIRTENEFFDYAAKYEGKSEEITPAPISDFLKREIHRIAEDIYHIMNCKGVIRIDFKLVNDRPHIIEVNTVPGFSEASIVPQQLAEAGISIQDMITSVLQQVMD